jgi:chromate transporter
VAALFLRLGFTAFGGPAAHIALMRDEIVRRRKWLDDDRFLDLIGATNLIPGPNSTEMALHLGHVRAGWAGLALSGLSFIVPAAAITLVLAWTYVRYGTTPTAESMLYGIKPVVIALIGAAVWELSRRAVKGPLTALVGLAAFGLYLAGWNELALLFAGGLLGMLVANRARLWRGRSASALLSLLGWGTVGGLAQAGLSRLPLLFLIFLKIGSVLYGSGYVLLAFLRADFVVRLGWLTDQQLVDAIAVGQVTPGPVFSSATFVGYIVAGLPGAVAATVGIFLPSFVFVILLVRWLPHMRRSPWLGALLDGVNVAALGLMAAVAVQLAGSAFVDWLAVVIGILAAAALVGLRVNAMALVVAGALLGLIRGALLGA